MVVVEVKVFNSRFKHINAISFLISGLCRFLNQKFALCTHWEGNVVLKKNPTTDESTDTGIVSNYIVHNWFNYYIIKICLIWFWPNFFNINTGYEIQNCSYWKALEGGETIATGRHIDFFVQSSNGLWLCKKRVIQHTWTKTDGQINP